jgi:hypothetical protein
MLGAINVSRLNEIVKAQRKVAEPVIGKPTVKPQGSIVINSRPNGAPIGLSWDLRRGEIHVSGIRGNMTIKKNGSASVTMNNPGRPIDERARSAANTDGNGWVDKAAQVLGNGWVDRSPQLQPIVRRLLSSM